MSRRVPASYSWVWWGGRYLAVVCAGVHLGGIYVGGVYLGDVCLTGVYLMACPLYMGMHLIGVHLIAMIQFSSYLRAAQSFLQCGCRLRGYAWEILNETLAER